MDAIAGITDHKSLQGRTKRRLIAIGKELNKIHPVLMPPELKTWLDRFAPLKYDGSAGIRQRRMLDKFQRSRGNGKRKTARAKVQIVPGEGNVYVNGKLAADFFKRTKDVENVIWPLQSLNALGQYNVWVSTWGGGTTGMFNVGLC
jgi:small subunit ribosomal protein S9